MNAYGFRVYALAPLRQQHADLFTPHTDTMPSFFAQQDHLGILNFIIDCLKYDFIANLAQVIILLAG